MIVFKTNNSTTKINMLIIETKAKSLKFNYNRKDQSQ